jgi:hypothetical protein
MQPNWRARRVSLLPSVKPFEQPSDPESNCHGGIFPEYRVSPLNVGSATPLICRALSCGAAWGGAPAFVRRDEFGVRPTDLRDRPPAPPSPQTIAAAKAVLYGYSRLAGPQTTGSNRLPPPPILAVSPRLE